MIYTEAENLARAINEYASLNSSEEHREETYQKCADCIRKLVNAILEHEGSNVSSTAKDFVADVMREDFSDVLQCVVSKVEDCGEMWTAPVDDDIQKIVQQYQKTLAILDMIEGKIEKQPASSESFRRIEVDNNWLAQAIGQKSDAELAVFFSEIAEFRRSGTLPDNSMLREYSKELAEEKTVFQNIL